MEGPGQFSNRVGEVGLLLSKAQERAQFSQGLRSRKIGDGLVERWVEGGTSLVNEVSGEDDCVARLRLLRVEGDAGGLAGLEKLLDLVQQFLLAVGGNQAILGSSCINESVDG